MGVLRFLWRQVLAFDRIGSRIPQLIQVWLTELFFVMPMTFFIGKVIDIHGAFGVPGTGERLGGVFWGALVVALIFGFSFVRSLVKPRVAQGSWTPLTHADIGPATVYGSNRAWKVTYSYLTSHPSYALLLLLTAPIPAVMLAATNNQGDSTFYFRVCGVVGLIILACMALARIVAWYVFRFGRRQLEHQLRESSISQRRLGWEIAWKPVLVLVVLMYAIVCIPLVAMWLNDQRTIAGLPVVIVADAANPGQYRRVEGTVVSNPVYWAPGGTGRGGNNHAGAGVLVALPSGGEALLLAEAMSVPDFKGMMAGVRGGALKATGKVIDDITADQRKYYGFDEAAFPQASSAGRVMLLLSTP
ncbi:hypothetical protein H7H78_16835 [Mycobacterium shinjukuense]|uniref:Uncharacterized protein n=1 Tax=Mycobacterium shinjukuense TaxID=398694 RepID=A0A7I7MPS7_9MYCO|nr:hypothetical protein [Mycobacterium shinjukuense]MCV6987019.1 hypothetical protein [Mycobacterium shinjukuense]ORB71096.1 hypothetical protein BST45_03655 [Mycobacterium shinjukuense]BBX73533.1 hypothetical protein MSHI_14390 [Mycobacterium shinjukuense]